MSSSLNADENRCLLRLDALADGALAAVDAVVDGAVESLIVHRDGVGAQAWLNICPHAGRRLDWSPGQFLKSREGLLVCAVHGASFELDSGRCVSGPCVGERLRAVAVAVDDGWVRVVGAEGDAVVPPDGGA